MTFTTVDIEQVLNECGLLPLEGKPDPEAPLVKIITAAMHAQAEGEPFQADNQLSDEIGVLERARAAIMRIEVPESRPKQYEDDL
jgi:hypothetical protein